MTKFFRKHSRILLLVFMAVLMVVFVIGDAIGRGGWGNDVFEEEVGRAFGQPVTTGDLQRAATDLQIALSLNLLPNEMQTMEFLGRGDLDASLAVHLLTQEAAAAGITLDESQIAPVLQGRGVQDAHFDMVRQRFGLSRDGIFRSLARVLAIQVMAETQAAAAGLIPQHELAADFREYTQSAQVAGSVLDAKAFLHQIEPPTDEELQAAFEQARDRETAHTPEELVFGYRLPDRVQIEYLTVDPERIKDLVMIRETEARRYYEENQARFRKPAEGPLAEGGAAQIPQSYDEVREQVREAVRLREAIRESQRLVNAMHTEARQPWDAARDGAPAPDQVASFEALQQQYSDQYAVDYQRTDWLKRTDLLTMPVLSQAATTIDGKRVSALNLAFHVDGLTPQPALAEIPPLRLNEPSPVLLTQRAVGAGEFVPYQAVIFRVVGVQPAAPAESLAEVRQQVSDDLMLQRAWELAGDYAQRLAEQARAAGLAQAVEQAEELRQILTEAAGPAETPETQPAITPQPAAGDYLAKLTPFEPPQFSRRGAAIHGVRSPLLIDEVFGAAAQGADAPATAPATQPGDESRVVVVPAARQQAWIVAEVQGVQPLYQGQFDQIRPMIEQQQQQQARQLFRMQWCRPENVKRRADYVDARPPETEDLETTAAAVP